MASQCDAFELEKPKRDSLQVGLEGIVVKALEDDPLAGWSITIQRIIHRSQDAIFQLLSDVELVAGLGPEHEDARWLTEQRGPGARFDGTNRIGHFEWTVTCTVTASIRPKLFSWSVGDPLEPSSTWTYILDPALKASAGPTGGATTVTHTFEHGPGYSYIRRAIERDPAAAHRIVAARTSQLRQNMTSTLQNIELRLARRDGEVRR